MQLTRADEQVMQILWEMAEWWLLKDYFNNSFSAMANLSIKDKYLL